MKRILFIAQHSFPIRSSESICNSKVAFSLAEAGYKIDVFSVGGYSSYPEDDEVDKFLRSSGNLTVYEIKNHYSNYYLSRSHSIIKNLRNAIGLLKMAVRIRYCYNGMGDAYDIYLAVRNHIEELGMCPYDIVMTRAYEAELAGLYLKKQYNIKWIANWNDPYPICRFPEPYGRGPKTKIALGYQTVYDEVEHFVDIHTFPSERLRNYMLNSFDSVKRNKTQVIPHMAHSQLFNKKSERQGNGCFRIVSCGSVKSPRNPSSFIKALKAIVHELSLGPKDIRCFFIGSYDPFVPNLVKECGLEDIVELQPPMAYSKSIDFISSCDMSLIIEAECEEGIYLPTKFVDSIQCKVPVFCVSPTPGTLQDLVSKYKIGYYGYNKDEDSILESLRKAVSDFKRGKIPSIQMSQLSDFFEKDIVKRYEHLFNSL